MAEEGLPDAAILAAYALQNAEEDWDDRRSSASSTSASFFSAVGSPSGSGRYGAASLEALRSLGPRLPGPGA